MKKEILSTLKSLTLALFLVAGVSYAWTGPTAAPPDPNVAAPINVGGSPQVKTGALTAGSLTATNGNVYFGAQRLAGNGTTFGIVDADGNWSYLAVKDNYTQFRINNSPKMNVWVDGRVGAAQYCNLGGTSCVSAGALGSGTNAGNLYRCPQAGAYNSGCVGQLQLGDANCMADMTIAGTNVSCPLVGRLYVQ